jgi:hypothetical protein
MWNGGNQVEADSINILMKNKRIHRMDTNVNSFIISQDTIKNFNQVKGKKMVAYFKDDKISRVNVTGNGQSIYYAMEEGVNKVIGLNKAECSNIVIKFDSGAVRNITFVNKPDAKFIPPHEIVEAETRLKGFQWRIKEKPSREEVALARDLEKYLYRLDYGAYQKSLKEPVEFVQIPYARGYHPAATIKEEPKDHEERKKKQRKRKEK